MSARDRPPARRPEPSGRGRSAGRAASRPPLEPARPLGDLLRALLKTTPAGRAVGRERLEERWRAAIGDELAAQARPLGLRQGTLEVEVDSAALLQELSTFYRAELLAALARSGGAIDAGCEEIRELRFRLRRDGAGG